MFKPGFCSNGAWRQVLMISLLSIIVTAASVAQGLPSQTVFVYPGYITGVVTGAVRAPCGVEAPTFGGCDDSCKLSNAMRSVVIAGAGKIPEGGAVISKIIGVFWPVKKGPPVNQKLREIVDYIQALVAETQSHTLTDVVDDTWKSLNISTTTLHDYIDKKGSSEQRLIHLEMSLGYCNQLWAELTNKDITRLEAIPYIAPVGNLCLSLYQQQAYNYKYLIGKDASDPDHEEHREILDENVARFQQLRYQAAHDLRDWRTKTPTIRIDSKGKGTGLCGFNRWKKRWIEDQRCLDVGGPKFSKNAAPYIVYQKRCGNFLPMRYFQNVLNWYQAAQARAWEDNYLGRWGLGSFALWESMTTDAVDNHKAPTIEYATAQSILTNMNGWRAPESYLIKNNQTEADELAEAAKAAVAQGVDVRLQSLQVKVTKDDSMMSMRTMTTIGSKSFTTTVGRWGRRDKVGFSWTAATQNTIVTGIEATPQKICVQTQELVNGILPKQKKHYCWGGNEQPGPGVTLRTAPAITANTVHPDHKGGETAYVPRVIGVSGLWEDAGGVLRTSTPIWLYERYKDTYVPPKTPLPVVPVVPPTSAAGAGRAGPVGGAVEAALREVGE